MCLYIYIYIYLFILFCLYFVFALLFDICRPTSILVNLANRPIHPQMSPNTGCNFDGFYLDSFACLAVLA